MFLVSEMDVETAAMTAGFSLTSLTLIRQYPDRSQEFSCSELGMVAQGTFHNSSPAEYLSRTKAFALEPQCPFTANVDDNFVPSVIAGIGILELAQVMPYQRYLRTISGGTNIQR